jgi:hypothetical protein
MAETDLRGLQFFYDYLIIDQVFLPRDIIQYLQKIGFLLREHPFTYYVIKILGFLTPPPPPLPPL